MNPDKYQQAWRSESSQSRVNIHPDLLQADLARHQRSFLTTIFWRDFREVGVAVVLLPLWIYMGVRGSLPWTWYLTVPALLWIIGFIVVDRLRHKQTPSDLSQPLLHSVKASLAQVEHQIWMLRNVFWWYLLPFCVSLLAFFAQISWQTADGAMEFVGSLFSSVLFVSFVYGLIYFVNQRAVRTQLEPRRQELLTLLASLSDETYRPLTTYANSHEFLAAPVSPSAFDRYPTPSSVAVRSVVALCAGLAVLLLLSITVVWQSIRLAQAGYAGPAQSSGELGDSLAKLVTNLRSEKKLVGLAAMVMVDGKVEGVAVQGERKSGSRVSLQISDSWHLGGITKSITATMIGRLVESGQMEWSDTVGEAFPEPSTHEVWKPITLRQLLTDTAGAPAQFPRSLWTKRIPVGPERTQARRAAALDVVSIAPTYLPGTKYEYSNVGYTIAGAMAEKVTGVTWEDLVVREVFEPLGLPNPGFGPPKSPDGSLPQPRGHRAGLWGKVAVDDETDNSPIMGPAATVHMTLSDLCSFATEHMRGELGEGKLLSAETYKLLHTPERDSYAFGWIMNQPNANVPHSIYWHNGSNTLWYAMVAFIPETKKVVAITSNDGDMVQAEAAALEILSEYSNAEYSKRSPFTAVRWKETQLEVQLVDEWFSLVSLNELPASTIVAFSQETNEDQWKQRIEEDLVEVLTRMGHPPQDKVTLVVRSPTTGEESVRKDVPMTEENRWAIYRATRSAED